MKTTGDRQGAAKQTNETEVSPETDLCICGTLIYEGGGAQISERVLCLVNSTRWPLSIQKQGGGKKLDLYFTPDTKINSRCMRDLSAEGKASPAVSARSSHKCLDQVCPS